MFRLYYCLFIYCSLVQHGASQQSLDASIVNSKVIAQNSNSVDIQLCVGGLLASDRPGFERACSNTLQTIMASTAIHLINEYTADGGIVCFVYLYQASNSALAQQAFQLLFPPGQTTATPIHVLYNDVSWECVVQASPWQDISASPFGVALPFEWSANDLLLWGLCGGAVLTLTAVFLCICIVRVKFDDVRVSMSRLRSDEMVLINLLKMSNETTSKNAAPSSQSGAPPQRLSPRPTSSTAPTFKDGVHNEASDSAAVAKYSGRL